MRKRTLPILLLILLLLSAIPGSAQVSVETKLNTAEILIGEHATLTAIVNADSRQGVKFPDYVANDTLMKGIEVLACGSIDTVRLDAGKRVRLTRNYTITSFDSALYNLPPIEVLIDGKPHRSRSRLGLKVGSVPVDTVHIDQFAPPYGITESRYQWNGNLLWLSLVPWLLLAALMVLAIRLSDKKPMTKKITIQPPTPPFKRASMELEEVGNMAVTNDESNKQYFVKLTEAVRTYLDGRFKFNALEKTTSEIMDGMAGVVQEDNARQLREIFETADYVKFAKQRPTTQERERCHATARKFIEETRDMSMENPQPIVRIVELSSRKQRMIRLGQWAAFVVSTIACLSWTAWTAWQIYDLYL